VSLLLPAASADAGSGRGSAGVGDPYFPKAGNGGYEVLHYGLKLNYDPGSGRLRGAARIEANPTESLRRFHLDFRGPRISSLEVDGKRASFDRRGQELIVKPRDAITDVGKFRVNVRYRGKPHEIVDPDGSIEGWVRTADGAFVVGEPQGSPTWFPCNDHPIDKATYRFRVTVPKGTKAIANGVLLGRDHRNGHTTFEWRERDPMATYLATVTTGKFALERSTANGLPSWVAIDPSEAGPGTDAVLDLIPDILGEFDSTFGAYPFDSTGAIVDHAPAVGYALETQTKPIFPNAPSEILLAHELAHQWFGNSVTLRRWKDIWLNEGFATFSEWLWTERTGGMTAAQKFDDLYATPAGNGAFWNPPPGNPGGPEHLFDRTIYDRGAMTLEALRETVGNATFFDILRAWAADHRHANASTRDFVELAEAESGMELSAFFDDWLYEQVTPATGKPPAP
jgi:aminopeptidase N